MTGGPLTREEQELLDCRNGLRDRPPEPPSGQEIRRAWIWASILFGGMGLTISALALWR